MKAKEQRTTSAQPNEDTPLLLGLRVDQPFNNINCVSSRNKTAIWVILNAGVVAFVVLLLSVVAYSIAPDPPIVSYTLTLTYGYASPDGYEKTVFKANGQFPGPTLEVQQGDTLEVTVHNKLLLEGVTIHWHGILQKGTPWMDGAGDTVQCAIPAHGTFTYRFTIDQRGTFWWHAHVGTVRTSLHGPLIVHSRVPDPFVYDEERTILLNDWWHTDLTDQITGLLYERQFRWVGDPQSILHNGKGIFPCPTTTDPRCNISRGSNEVISVEAGKTYRLRIINVAALSYLNFGVEGHSLTIVEADGTFVDPYKVDFLEINAGQRYSVLLTANQPPANYWINTQTKYRNLVKGQAILHYTSVPLSQPTTPIPDNDMHSWNPSALVSSPSELPYSIPDKTQEFLLLGTQMRIDGYMRWAVNNISYEHPSTPVLMATYLKRLNMLPKDTHIIRVAKNEVVQLIIQNHPALNGVSEQHPWHIHGHSFWVLGHGDDVYDASLHESSLNTHNPLLCDTTTVYPHQWTVIRFVADNPGAWLFHCHISWHLVMGMAVAFVVGEDEIPPPPLHFPSCGDIY